MKIRYKVCMLFSCLFLSAFLTGCKTESMKSPEKLLEKPITNEFNYKIYNEIRKLTPIDTTFVLPKNAIDVGRINKVDLNSNGNKEIVAFKKRTNENQGLNSIYMYIFESQGDSIVDDSEKMVRISGDTIKYANFIDLNNDGKKEIVLHISNRGFENVYIYEYSNNVVKKKAEYNTSKYSIRLNFFDYNDDGKKECLAVLQDLTSYDVIFSKMDVIDGDIIFNKFETSKNIDSLDKVDIVNGKVAKDLNGSIFMYQSFNGSVISQVLIYKNDKFIKTLNEENPKLKNPFFMRPQDIDGDGVLEIPKIEFKFSNNTPKESNVVTWYKWNGDQSENSRLDISKQIFYCYDYNFKVEGPSNLNNKFFIQQKYRQDNSVFEFSYKNSNKKLEKLFNITVIVKNGEDLDKKKSEQENNILYEDEQYIYLYNPTNSKYLDKYKIDFNTVKKHFEIINR